MSDMFWRVEVKDKPGIFDAVGDGIKKDILDIGIKTVSEVSFIQVYFIAGHLAEEQIHYLARQLLCDPVIQEYSLTPYSFDESSCRAVEVAYRPGVMDPVEESARKAVADLGISGFKRLSTAKKYIIKGDLTKDELSTISEKLLFNKLIQYILPSGDNVSPSFAAARYDFYLRTVDIIGAGDRRLMRISRDGQLFLSLQEMRLIKKYFSALKRDPTDCELETLAQTWSEHCVHKTFKAKISYTEVVDGKKRHRIINNLLKSTIMKATKEMNKPWCVSVFSDNAGIIKFDGRNNICFKVETHNHPSALEPFGGANTGIGGVIRDILGCGMGARPFLNTDVFCFGSPDLSWSDVPAGALHPRRVIKGVVSGVKDYGNKMGIPTVNGAVIFAPAYVGNPLVYCGTAGILPKDKSFKRVKKGDLAVVVGGRTGRDGIHGATFSSGELTSDSESISSGAVQIGNPIQEKKVLDTMLKARDKGLYNFVTDCGAGGLSSAIGEMGAELGARVYLDKVLLKYSGLSYTEIWISESQERMVFAVPPGKIDELMKVFKDEDVEAACVGEFSGSGRLELFYEGNKVADLDMKFLHDGLKQFTKEAFWKPVRRKEPRLKQAGDLGASLKKMLSHYDVCSKEWIIRQYDHEVQGGSVVKPLCGILNDGPSDAAVVKPLLDSPKAVAVSNGINSRLGVIDPYWMAVSCVDEALRQIICVGGSLKRTALLDNFCGGNPDKADRLGAVVRSALGCYDAAKRFGVPFISGKDSLNNEYRVAKKSVSIPCTLLISAISVMDDASAALTMNVKQAGNLIYVVGNTYDELGGSLFYDLLGFLGNDVPKVRFPSALAIMNALSIASSRRIIRSVHDCSEGGLGVALAEMSFAGGLGIEVFLNDVPFVGSGKNRRRSDQVILFSESNSRFIVEVEGGKKSSFERLMKGLPFALIGCVTDSDCLRVYGTDNDICISADIADLKDSWQRPLRW